MLGAFNRSTSTQEPCSDIDGPLRDWDTHRIMKNVSSHRQVLTSTQNGITFSFLAPVNPVTDLDFIASTFAASSSCRPISRACNLTYSDVSSPSLASGRTEEMSFRCSDNFWGSNYFKDDRLYTDYVSSCLYNQDGCVAFYADISLNATVYSFSSQYQSHPSNSSTKRYTNPFFAGVFGGCWPTSAETLLENDVEVVNGFGSWIILNCEITMYELTYLWANNSIISANLTLASDDVAALVRTVDEPAQVQFTDDIRLATLLSNTSDQVALNYASNLEKTLLAFSAGLWESGPAQQEQIRHSLLVTRVPKAPLFILVSLCILFVSLSIAIALVTLTESRSARSIQAWLNIFGVIASRFEDPERTELPVNALEDVFGERTGTLRSTRVGIGKTKRGGRSFVSFRGEEAN